MKINSLLFLFIASFFLLNCNSYAQQSSSSDIKSVLTISSTGEALAPVDRAMISINISLTDENAEVAFELHKERERFLAGLLSEMDLSDEKVNYQPVNIRPNQQRNGDIHSTTSQRVQLELEDFEQLSDLQIKLISNGFDNFSGNLTSSKLEEAGTEALQQAVKNARIDAEILAEAAGKTVGSVLSIDYSAESGFRPAARAEAFQLSAMSDAGPSLGDFAQTVPVSKRVQVVFELKD